MIRRVITAAGGLLVLFHGWLLGSQLWHGQLAEPGLVLRWMIAAGLVVALAGFRRRGGSMFWGRKAVAIWLLAALLHGPAAMAEHTGFESPALPEAVTAILQIAAASTIAGLSLLLLVALVAVLFAEPAVGLRPVAVLARIRRGLCDLSRFAPRPPPLRP
jgi:hypothetical protein